MRRRTAERQRAFLAAFAETGRVRHTARQLGLHHVVVYQWRNLYPEFAREMDEARQNLREVALPEDPARIRWILSRLTL